MLFLQRWFGILIVLLSAAQPLHADAQEAIECGKSIAGDIAPAGEIDSYKFFGLDGEVLAIAVTKGSTSQRFSPCWQLYDATGNTVGGAVCEKNQGRTLPRQGSYTIRVWDWGNDALGEYRLHLEPVSATFGGKPSCAEPIVCGDDLQGTIRQNECASYAFSGVEGETIAIGVTKHSASQRFSPCWQLHDAGGNPVGGAVCEKNQGRTLPREGSYTIRLCDWDNDASGEYKLRLEPVSATFGGEPSCAERIGCGDNEPGILGIKEVHSYRFSGRAGEEVTIGTKNFSDHRLFNPCWQLFDAGGSSLGGAVCEKNHGRILPREEIYTIRVFDWDHDGAGAYELSLLGNCTRPEEATALDAWTSLTVRLPANLAEAVRYLERVSMYKAGALNTMPQAAPVVSKEHREIVQELVGFTSEEAEP
jgi:hypothetical protein